MGSVDTGTPLTSPVALIIDAKVILKLCRRSQLLLFNSDNNRGPSQILKGKFPKCIQYFNERTFAASAINNTHCNIYITYLSND